MRKLLFAVLLALGLLPAPVWAQNQTANWGYAPDYSNVEIWDPHLWNPVVVTGSYGMTAADLVVVINAPAGAVATLPKCTPGMVRMLVNSSAPMVGGVANVVQAQPAVGDVFIAGSATGGPANFAYTLSTGTTKFRAVGTAGSGCAWAWSN